MESEMKRSICALPFPSAVDNLLNSFFSFANAIEGRRADLFRAVN